MNLKRANEVYDILVRECGASPDEDSRSRFVQNMSDFEDRSHDEYRFMGPLGGGGKFRYGSHRVNKYYVDCYTDDRTPERDTMIKRTNVVLAALFVEEVNP